MLRLANATTRLWPHDRHHRSWLHRQGLPRPENPPRGRMKPECGLIHEDTCPDELQHHRSLWPAKGCQQVVELRRRTGSLQFHGEHPPFPLGEIPIHLPVLAGF